MQYNVISNAIKSSTGLQYNVISNAIKSSTRPDFAPRPPDRLAPLGLIGLSIMVLLCRHNHIADMIADMIAAYDRSL